MTASQVPGGGAQVARLEEQGDFARQGGGDQGLEPARVSGWRQTDEGEDAGELAIEQEMVGGDGDGRRGDQVARRLARSARLVVQDQVDQWRSDGEPALWPPGARCGRRAGASNVPPECRYQVAIHAFRAGRGWAPAGAVQTGQGQVVQAAGADARGAQGGHQAGRSGLQA